MSSVSRLLRAQPTPLVDRTGELDAILQRLTVEGARLLTLTGPAGVGKTRLALAAAQLAEQVPDRFPDGVVVVDLTPVRDPHQVLGALARACGFTDTDSPPLGERLAAFLRQRALLLVLDNVGQTPPTPPPWPYGPGPGAPPATAGYLHLPHAVL